MTAVVFNPAAFIARYPEFAAVPTPTLTAYFTEACLYLSNSDTSPVQSIPRRTLMLNMLTAHVAFLAARDAGAVGRTASAGEGSVNASFEFAPPGSAPWFSQSQYGAAFWQATTALRGMRYIPRPTCY